MGNVVVKTPQGNAVALQLNEGTLHFSVEANGGNWSFTSDYRPSIVTASKTIYFADAKSITHTPWKTGIGEGFRSTFKGFEGTKLEFETIAWIESTTGHVFFEFIPLCECEELISEIFWPGAMSFDEGNPEWYSVMNVLQGFITPNTWETEISRETNNINFDGQFCSTGAYMPWWGQVRPGSAYMAICVTPWDAGYTMDHPANGPYTHVIPRFIESLGGIGYRRIYQYRFFGDCNYNTLCKEYRSYVKETGLLVTLNEKAARCGYVDKLIGSAIVHKGIKSHTAPASRFYDASRPEDMDKLTTFKVRTNQMRKLKASGLSKVYFHLDGWGDPGYDNKHPDYLPACEAAGGWEGMKELSDTMKEANYMFGVHDQYRDYYFDAPTFDREFAALKPDGTIEEHARWAGGHQTYICASQAPFYVKRNFEELFRHGIHLEGTYLDVFTCNEGDECIHPWHKMSRKECFEYRKACFDYLLSRDILPSSEEVVDWAMQSLVFAHYGPYDFMLCKESDPKKGIPTPLFNLVYHDCVILPWMMDKTEKNGDYMLYALLNGGGAYLDCEADGDNLDDEIARYRIVAALQEKVAKSEMIRHEFIDGYNKERAYYDGGITVTIDHVAQTYKIEER